MHWLNAILQSSTVAEMVRRVHDAGDRGLSVNGSQGSSATLLAGAFAAKAGRPVLLVVGHLDDADDAVEDLSRFADAGVTLSVHRFGALEVLPGETNVSLELLAERLAVVRRLVEGRTAGAEVIVAPIQALMQAAPTPEALADLSVTLRPGDAFGPGRLATWLTTAGYHRVDAVEQPGDFAIRGGIVDVYPPVGVHDGLPFRIDYFGDEIDTLCAVDPDTLGSGVRLEEVSLIGAQADQLQRDDRTTGLWSLLPEPTVVVLHEIMELTEQARGYYERLTNPVGIYPPRTVFKHLAERRLIEINQYSGVKSAAASIQAPVRPLAPVSTDASQAVAEIGELALSGDVGRLLVLCEKRAERDRLAELIREHASEARASIELVDGYLHRGFLWDDGGDERFCLLPHHELFHRYDARRPIRRLGAGAASAAGSGRSGDAFFDIQPGDYVVHTDHGVARFVGVKTMKREGKQEEFLTLEFAMKATLHVPATQIDLVQRYVGGFQGAPPLSALGGKRWGRQKEAVREAVKDLAAELLRVQAARSSMPGIRYPAETAWQNEFEAEFPFEETEDQLAAIAAVKQDMAAPQPMDRLICGDVGFGKTEVAIRAAFKAAEYGRQVAVLVPTTVLAEQHERTFKSRLADFPFRVESLSRFKTGMESRKLLDRLARGQVDIIIGTHRLLSKDVKFADLGLVIIDEEQRFGVEHKNRLLEIRLTADVLTLSATPIPRTLHMAMLGLRDISSLTTPPADRRSIVTEVITYDENRIRQALIRELNREGQVFFVHNRIHDLQSVADDIQRLVPDARVEIGHGQMKAHELERVMLRFIRRETDVLVSTTIIESGIDIPTANTMFINRADHFGLSELHQLRGRVGRYKHRAYCYLLLPREGVVTDQGVQRLTAIEQYAMLGAGFKIAMRDLEIRGAGNLLGAEQSGHIAAVGYELYCVLLEQETKRLKHEPDIEPAKTHIELPVAGSIPKAYMPSDKFRLDAYRRLSRSRTLAELDRVIADLTAAYGDPPTAARALFDITELRIAATCLGVDRLRLEDQDLIFTTHEPAALEPVLSAAPGRTTVLDDRTVYYRPPANYLSPPETLLAVLRKLLVRPIRDREAQARIEAQVQADEAEAEVSSTTQAAAPDLPQARRLRVDRQADTAPRGRRAPRPGA